MPAGESHVNNWSLEGVEGLPEDGKLDLTKLGLGETSMRVRTGRNLKAFPLPGGMSQQEQPLAFVSSSVARETKGRFRSRAPRSSWRGNTVL